MYMYITKHPTRPKHLVHVAYNPYDILIDVNKTTLYGTALCSSMRQTLSIVFCLILLIRV